MLLLTLRTDKPEAELGLYDDDRQIAYVSWQAHRELAETIHVRINQLLKEQGMILSDIQGIVVYQGPGSFTGLRIGISVANALAYGLGIPIVAESDENWIQAGQKALAAGQNQNQVLPNYGAEVKTTEQRK